MKRIEKKPEQAQWEMIEAKSDQSQKMKPHQKIREIGNFLLRASTQVIKNQKPKSF
jgi:hypothetical protein